MIMTTCLIKDCVPGGGVGVGVALPDGPEVGWDEDPGPGVEVVTGIGLLAPGD
jgi:hypothetical protein